jgi:hypothetical protein
MSAPRFNKIAASSIVAKDEVTQDYGMLIRLACGPTKEPFRFQTPLSRLAWEPTVRSKYNPDSPSAVLSISLDPAIDEFKTWLTEVDTHIKQMVVANSEAWFGKKFEEGFVSGVYGGLVKPPSDPKWSETFTPKIPLKKDTETGEWNLNIKVFKANKELGDAKELLTKNSEVVAVVQVPYVFVNRSTKAVTVRCDVEQCCAIPAPQQDAFQMDLSSEPRMVAAAAEANANKRSFEAVDAGEEAGDENGSANKQARVEYEADGDDV